MTDPLTEAEQRDVDEFRGDAEMYDDDGMRAIVAIIDRLSAALDAKVVTRLSDTERAGWAVAENLAARIDRLSAAFDAKVVTRRLSDTERAGWAVAENLAARNRRLSAAPVGLTEDERKWQNAYEVQTERCEKKIRELRAEVDRLSAAPRAEREALERIADLVEAVTVARKSLALVPKLPASDLVVHVWNATVEIARLACPCACCTNVRAKQRAGGEDTTDWCNCPGYDEDERCDCAHCLDALAAPAEDDLEPQPSDGPEYHEDHRAWEQRQERARLAACMEMLRQVREALGDEACARADAGAGGWIGLLVEIEKLANPLLAAPAEEVLMSAEREAEREIRRKARELFDRRLNHAEAYDNFVAWMVAHADLLLAAPAPAEPREGEVLLDGKRELVPENWRVE